MIFRLPITTLYFKSLLILAIIGFSWLTYDTIMDIIMFKCSLKGAASGYRIEEVGIEIKINTVSDKRQEQINIPTTKKEQT